jgi:hypothetical protein
MTTGRAHWRTLDPRAHFGASRSPTTGCDRWTEVVGALRPPRRGGDLGGEDARRRLRHRRLRGRARRAGRQGLGDRPFAEMLARPAAKATRAPLQGGTGGVAPLQGRLVRASGRPSLAAPLRPRRALRGGSPRLVPGGRLVIATFDLSTSRLLAERVLSLARGDRPRPFPRRADDRARARGAGLTGAASRRSARARGPAREDARADPGPLHLDAAAHRRAEFESGLAGPKPSFPRRSSTASSG